jgi:hypothetical protein
MTLKAETMKKLNKARIGDTGKNIKTLSENLRGRNIFH